MLVSFIVLSSKPVFVTGVPRMWIDDLVNGKLMTLVVRHNHGLKCKCLVDAAHAEQKFEGRCMMRKQQYEFGDVSCSE